MTEGEDPTLQDPWELLELEPGATAQEASRAFRRLSAAAHTDSGGLPEQAGNTIARLEAARDLIVAADHDRQLPAVRELRELIVAQSRTLVRQEQRREAHSRAERAKHTLIRHEISPLNERKRQAQGVAAVSTGLAAVGAVLRSVAVPPFNEAGAAFIGPFLGVLALLIAITGAAAFALSQRAQRVARHVEDASETLGDMPSCLEILDEIEAASDTPSPWTSSRLAEAIEVWAHSNHAGEGTIAALAATVGGREFRRLLSAAAIQHGLLVEDLTADGERHHTIYRREFPGSTARAAQGEPEER